MNAVTEIPAAAAITPLEAAGLRLDAARATFTAVCHQLTIGEEAFGKAEDALSYASAAYRAELLAVTGCDPAVILGRLEA